MKSDEIDVFAGTMPCHFEKVTDAGKTAGAGDFRSDLLERDRFDRINFDLALLHPVPSAYRDTRAMPHANGAGDGTRPHGVAQIPDEQHDRSLNGTEVANDGRARYMNHLRRR